MSQYDNVSVVKKANVYFDGKCVSNTGAPEIMEGVGGSCRVKLKGESEWKTYSDGQSFNVPGNSSFEISVADGESYHYVCHFG